MTPELDDEKKAELSRVLAQREADLLDAVRGLRDAVASPAEGTGPQVRDSVEDGDARMMSALDITQLRRTEGELHDVRAARQRMADGRYGTCEECGEPIPFPRLKARPEARLCLPHEEAWEKAHPEPHHPTA